MAASDNGRESFLHGEVLRRLFRRLEATDVDELEITSGDARLFIRRDLGQRTAVVPPSDGAGLGTPGVPIPAPLTGIFYSRPSPSEPVYASVGDTISAGQIVGLIETMKLFNEVTSEVTGRIVEVMVEDGQLVEAGHPLMYVSARDEKEET